MHSTACLTDRGLGPHSGEDRDARMVRPRFSSSSDSASTDLQEESLAWRSLPSDILERALALLPLPEVFRLRLVCKRWNALIQCAQFQEWSLRCPVPWGPFYLPWIRWTAKGSQGLRVVPWRAYDFAERQWIRMPQFEFPLLHRTSSWSLVTANGGLVCFRSADGRRTLVCNPLTNRWKELPCGRLDSTYTAISCMIVDEQRSSYKIIFAGNATYKWKDPCYGTVDLYDSMTNTWSIGQNVSVRNTLKSGAYYNGELYCLTRHGHKGPYVVEILDLITLRWREETIPIPDGFWHYPCIVACLGQIYLVGVVRGGGFGRIDVFQLDENNGWTAVSNNSDGQFLGFSGLRGCGSNGSKIYVVTSLPGPGVAVYDCATSFWEVPSAEVAILNMEDIYQTKFTFQPNLRVAP